MGEIADGLINGDFDYITGEYIGNGGGFPRTFNDKKEKALKKEYWNSLPKEEKTVKETYNKIKGKQHGAVRARDVANFLHKEFKIIQLPKAQEQYKIIYDNLDKFKEYLKSSI